MKLRDPLEAWFAGLVTRKGDGRRGARGYWDRSSRYDGAALRAIRAEKGVGRPPLGAVKSAARLRRQRGWKVYPAYVASCVASWWGRESTNYAEWMRKPRSKRHAAQGAKK